MHQPLSNKTLFLSALAVTLVFSIALGYAARESVVAQNNAKEAESRVVLARAAVANAFAKIKLTAKAAIVVDLSNNSVLYSKNPDTQLPLASLTKLITLYAATQALSSSTPVTISDTAYAQDGDSGLLAGETFALRDLGAFTLVASSNDGAEAIAERTGEVGSSTTQTLMASAVSALGLSRTNASNGTGLDLSSTTAGSYGTARDITLLANSFLNAAPEMAAATTKPTITIFSNSGKKHTQKNTNQFVAKVPGLRLSKTGYTDLAGGNLVIVFDAGINHRVAIAVLGSSIDDRFTDVSKLTRATLLQFAQKPSVANVAAL